MLLTVGIIAYAVMMIVVFVAHKKSNPSNIMVYIFIASGAIAVVCVGMDFLIPKPTQNYSSISVPTSVSDSSYTVPSIQNNIPNTAISTTSSSPQANTTANQNSNTQFTYTGESGISRSLRQSIEVMVLTLCFDIQFGIAVRKD